MKVLKKLSFLGLIMFCFATLFFINASATSSDASTRGFNVGSDWIYVSDATYSEKQVNGTKYYEGSMWSWMGIYKYYDSTNNEMIVMLLCESEMQPNQASYWDQRRWNNQEMKVTFSSPTSGVSLITYSPEATVGSITITNSVTVSAKTNGETAELGFSATTSSSYTTSEVTVTTLRSGTNGISIKHNFVNYKTNKSLLNICCSHVYRNNVGIYKISNYNSNNSYGFCVEHKSTFYRYGVFNSASTSDTYTQYFSI